jgi:hypothetical protein
MAKATWKKITNEGAIGITGRQTKWLEFDLTCWTGKTKTFHVRNSETKFVIGIIKWYGAFRKYSFFPTANCVFESKCLGDIADFLKDLMDERKPPVKPVIGFADSDHKNLSALINSTDVKEAVNKFVIKKVNTNGKTI